MYDLAPQEKSAELTRHMAPPVPAAAVDRPFHSVQRSAGNMAMQRRGREGDGVQDVLRSPGQPLDRSTREWMESRFGTDFSGVRVHSDWQAGNSALALNARAYTVGSNIVFAGGQYAPHTSDGRKLIAHELTHVVQQGGGTPPPSARLRMDTSGEAAAERVSDRVTAGGAAGPVDSGHGPSIQGQLFGLTEVPTAPFETPIPYEPFIEPRIVPPEAPLPGDGISVPEGGFPEGGEVLYPRPTPGPAPWFGPGTDVFPPVYPRPGEQPDTRRRSRRACGSPMLPVSLVSRRPGPLGQGGRVKASPLTRCPGNTVGSEPDPNIFKDQFACIAQKDPGYWVRGHLLHGETSSSGPRNLHGPGDEAWNLIIIDKSLNGLMRTLAEGPVLNMVYGDDAVLWYDVVVDAYTPGLPFFADALTVEFGFYEPLTHTEGPKMFSYPFTLSRNPPYCPAMGLAGAVFPWSAHPSTFGFQSSFEVCSVLKSRYFDVTDGGLIVAIDAKWVRKGGDEADRGKPCPNEDYFVHLSQYKLLLDHRVDVTRVTAGQRVILTYRELESVGEYHYDKYYVKIIPWPNRDDDDCCLEGEILVTPFSAPDPRKRRPEADLA